MSRYVTLVWKKNKIVNVSFYAESCQITVFTNSAGFLIRCMRLFDAIREELVPYGTQTFPSVASASLHLINGICAGICSILLFISSLKLTPQGFIFLPQPSGSTFLSFLPSTPKMLTVREFFILVLSIPESFLQTP